MSTASTTDTGTLQFRMADEHGMGAAIVGAPVRFSARRWLMAPQAAMSQEPARGEMVL